MHHVLSLLPFRPCFEGWTQPQQQHDAAELMLHLIHARDDVNELCKWRSYAQTDAGDELESYGNTIIPLHIPDTQEGVTLDSCIQAWRTQESARYPGVTCLHYMHGQETHG